MQIQRTFSYEKNIHGYRAVHFNFPTLKIITQRLVLIIVPLFSTTAIATQLKIELNEEKVFNLVTAVYPPYNYQDGEIKGLNIEIIKAAFSAMAYQIQIDILPFGRAFLYAKEGKYDGITLWHSEQRTQWFEFSDPFTHSELVFYKRKSLKINYQSLSDITPYTVGTVGTVQKYAYPTYFLNDHKIIKDQVLTDERNIKKLILGRIDLALIDKRMAQFIMRKNYPKQQHLFGSAGILKNEFFYLAISKNTKHYLQKLKDFNLGLATIKTNGVLAEIINKYE